MALKFKRLLIGLTLLVVLMPLSLVAFYLWVHLEGNFHPVIDHEIYRSGQLNNTELKKRAEEIGLKSILNLRGVNSDAPWYQEEMKASKDLGLEHLDFTLSASTPVSAQELKTIIEMIHQAPKPLLIHCTDGADRSGLISAVYLLSVGQPISTAREQLSLQFGHFPYLIWSFSRAMDQSLESYLQESQP
jgi:protein tyrosine/serine phosphatase